MPADAVQGRVADYLIKRNGTRVSGISLIENTLTRWPGMRQMQIVQDSLESMRVRIVRARGFESHVAEAVQSYLREVFGEQVTITVEFPDEIRQEPSGKYRFAICAIPSVG